MTLLLTLLFLLVTQIAIARRARVDGVLSPILVVAFSILFYTVSVPVELWLRGTTLLGFTQQNMVPEIAEKVLLAALLGFLALYVGYSSLARRSLEVDLVSHAAGVPIARAVTFASAGLGAVLLATLFRSNVVVAQDYLGNVAQTADTGGATGYFLVNRWTYLSFGMFAFLSIARSSNSFRSVLWLAPLLGWSVYSNDKDPLLVALMASAGLLFSKLHRRRVPPGASVALAMIALIVFVGVGAALYGIARAGNTINAATVSAYVSEGLFTNIDPAGPSATLAVSLAQDPGSGSFAVTIRGAFSWVPNALLPFEVGEDLGVTFARQYFPNWQPGFGYGYSPLAEGWLAAGYVGVTVIFFFVGVMLGGVRNWLLKPSDSRPQTVVVKTAAYFVVLGYLSFTFMRGSTMSLLSNAATCAVLVLLTAAVASSIARRSEKPPTRHKVWSSP